MFRQQQKQILVLVQKNGNLTRNFHNRRYRGRKNPRESNDETRVSETSTHEEITNPKNFPNLKKGEIPNVNRPKPTFEFLNSKKKKTFKKVKKQKISEEEFDRKVSEHMTKERGGGSNNFDHGITEGMKDFYEGIERTNPQAFEQGFEINKDTSGWLFRDSPELLQKKPGVKFEQKLLEYRKGDLIDPKRWKDTYKENVNKLPLFIKKPKDPFRANPHLIRRISYKDPSLLYKFLTPTGKIQNNRYTGVRWKTQRKIKTEIKKARFLGIISFVSNPEYKFGNQYQPSIPIPDLYDIDAKIERDEKEAKFAEELESRHKDHLKNYLKNLENDISYGYSDQTSKIISNPKISNKKIQNEIRGRLDGQMKEKQKEIEFVDKSEEFDIPNKLVKKLNHLSLKNKLF
eukprot:gene4616-7998_t